MITKLPDTIFGCTGCQQKYSRLQEFEQEVEALKATIRLAYFWLKDVPEDDGDGTTHAKRALHNCLIAMDIDNPDRQRPAAGIHEGE